MKKLRIILYEGTDEQMASQFRDWRQAGPAPLPDTRAGSLADGRHGGFVTSITTYTVPSALSVDTVLKVLQGLGLWPLDEEEEDQRFRNPLITRGGHA